MPIVNNSRGYKSSLFGGMAILLLATIAFSGGFQRVKAQTSVAQPEPQASIPRA